MPPSGAVNVLKPAFRTLLASESLPIERPARLREQDRRRQVFEEMTIVSRVLDGTFGKPAVGVRAALERANGTGWVTLAEAETNTGGEITDWDGWQPDRGLYRLVINSDSYFADLGVSSAYPEVTITFRMQNKSVRFQVVVTLSPYSYSTYFGTLEGQSADSI